MISIILTCDESGRSINLTEEHGVTSLKQAYFMMKNHEIMSWEVYKDLDGGFKHRYYEDQSELFKELGL